MEVYPLLFASTLSAGTVLALAALGLLINEKSGVVNLGAEGMMLCAAIAGFATAVHTGSDSLGFLAGMAVGGGMYVVAIAATLIILAILVALKPLENVLHRKLRVTGTLAVEIDLS